MKAARRAAREAAVAAQAELARRTRANMDDLAVFFSAQQRAEAVDDWLRERVAALHEQAAVRRGQHRRQCGAALAAMQQRGQSLREIAAMAGIGEKAVRDFINGAGEPGGEPAAWAKVNGAGAGTAERTDAAGGRVGSEGGPGTRPAG